jgi:hypothetical protein
VILIGLSGRARSGKTTASEAIAQHAGKDKMVRTYDIGAMVLDEAIYLGRIPKKHRNNLTPDELAVLVNLGFEKRAKNPDYWIERIAAKIKMDSADVALIPNIRYENEAATVRKLNGYLLNVKSFHRDGTEFLSPDRDPNHPSETEMANYPADFFIRAYRGESALIGEMAVTVYSYLEGLHA